ncbi:type VI secretion system tube protein Hcp [Haloferula sp. BvORR071]|uniref:type VI secretion system tube protein Hcp n=1 Tax=Haloferula sp. BvORR071 TaxID=1396141 RepID=UPI000698919F|nr:type VI secretion system tube protein Hcp [Haloferula sp. BvORR071]
MKTPHHRWPRRIFAALAGWVAALAFPVSAAPAIHGWLSFGPEVPGESTSPGHLEWMDFEAASVAGASPLPGSELRIRKEIDKASPLLMKACATGKVFEEAKVHWAVESEKLPSVFFSLVLRKVRVISVKHEGPNGNAGGPPFEDLELAHDGVRMTYIQLSDPTQLPLITNLPYTGDADGDGMPDSFEEQYGLQVHSDDGDLDSDNDGLTNLEESQVGTDPTKGTSFFKATAEPSPAGLVLTWNSVPGGKYNILYSATLAEPFEVIETVQATGPSTSHTLPRAGIKGFYQVEKAEP